MKVVTKDRLNRLRIYVGSYGRARNATGTCEGCPIRELRDDMHDFTQEWQVTYRAVARGVGT